MEASVSRPQYVIRLRRPGAPSGSVRSEPRDVLLHAIAVSCHPWWLVQDAGAVVSIGWATRRGRSVWIDAYAESARVGTVSITCVRPGRVLLHALAVRSSHRCRGIATALCLGAAMVLEAEAAHGTLVLRPLRPAHDASKKLASGFVASGDLDLHDQACLQAEIRRLRTHLSSNSPAFEFDVQPPATGLGFAR